MSYRLMFMDAQQCHLKPGAVIGPGVDVTDYARSIGYTGDKRVIVSHGKVVSHRKVCWFTFCDQCREGKQ